MEFTSNLDIQSQAYSDNKSNMKLLVQELNNRIDLVKKGGGEKSLERHKSRGKLTARERISGLIDPGSSFLEFSTLAAWKMYKDGAPGAGIVTGIGKVSNKICVIVANDATVKGGTYFPMTVKKHLRAQDIAAQNGLPCIYLVDSGGAFLPLQSEVFPDKDHFGRIFFNQAQMSAQGLAQVSIVMGSCTAGGAYVPAMSDENIIVKQTGTIFLGGPPLVKAATGEEVTAQELGGAVVHSSVSGVTDHIAENDDHALAIAREIFEFVPQSTKQELKRAMSFEEPKYNIEEVYGIIPKDPRIQYDIREVIARIVDASKFHEFKKTYGQSVVTCFASICGYPVGIVANNGVLFSESALKVAHFVQLCDQRETPIIFLQNISGFMVGKKYENEGIAKHGAKMVMAVSNVRVPKFTVVIGGSFGAGNYGMCGRAFEPRQMWMWPNSKISVMGGEQAANVLLTVKQDQLAKKNESMSIDEQKEFKAPILEKYEKESSCYFSSARIWDDGIIDPAQTRKVLALGIEASLNKKWAEIKPGVYRM